MDYVREILRCPRCRSRLQEDGVTWRCTNSDCTLSKAGFFSASGQPVLIDFEESIFTPEAFTAGHGSVLPRDKKAGRVASFLVYLTYGSTNDIALIKSREIAAQLRATATRPLILVIGGGTIGAGAAPLYEAEGIQVVGTDVYASPHTVVVSDAHQLPFDDQSFDGVWIQAVLEHVLNPQEVVKEIHRVLKPSGLVYADTPFMQQVHEGAYDFTRFTLSGHRWLFRQFDHIDSGVVTGPGMALLWSIAFFVRAHGGFRLATIITALFSWIRLLDRRAGRGPAADGASGVFFFGRKSSVTLRPKDMIAYYQSQR